MRKNSLAVALASLLAFAWLLPAADARAEPADCRCDTAASAPIVPMAQLLTIRHYAVQLMRERRYSAAYGRFAYLADAGHVPSAQVALVMHDQGKTLFDNEWSATPGQLTRWRALVACNPVVTRSSGLGGD